MNQAFGLKVASEWNPSSSAGKDLGLMTRRERRASVQLRQRFFSDFGLLSTFGLRVSALLVSPLYPRRPTLRQGAHLIQSCHRRVARERGQQRPMRPAQSNCRIFALP